MALLARKADECVRRNAPNSPGLRFNGQLWLFEFKIVELASEGTALAQIKARGYADKYRAEGLPIHLIGIEFSREQRTLVGFEVETLS